MEEEAEKLKEMQGEVEKQMMSAKSRKCEVLMLNPNLQLCVCVLLLAANAFPTVEEKQEADGRSVYVGNVSVCCIECRDFYVCCVVPQVDYQSTAEELGQHFQSCGAINRVTILCDKYSGNPKGYVVSLTVTVWIVATIWGVVCVEEWAYLGMNRCSIEDKGAKRLENN